MLGFLAFVVIVFGMMLLSGSAATEGGRYLMLGFLALVVIVFGMMLLFGIAATGRPGVTTRDIVIAALVLTVLFVIATFVNTDARW
jgi:hypothetical protein